MKNSSRSMPSIILNDFHTLRQRNHFAEFDNHVYVANLTSRMLQLVAAPTISVMLVFSIWNCCHSSVLSVGFADLNGKELNECDY